MLDRPQIISPDNHPEDCVVFVERAKTVSEFLRKADKLVLNGEHRIICWHPPHGESIEGMLEEEDGHGAFRLSEKRIHDMFLPSMNMHFDFNARNNGNEKNPVKERILSGLNCRLSQSLRGVAGTPLFFISPDHPRRQAFYDRLSFRSNADSATLDHYNLKGDIRGPFSMATGNVALLLPMEFGPQATLHGFPVKTRDEDSRKTLVAQLDLYGLR